MSRSMSTVAVLTASFVAASTDACIVIPPYDPLRAVPVGTRRALLVDVVATQFGPNGTTARLRVVAPVRGAGARGSVLTVRYLVSPCANIAEPQRGRRLVVYLAGDQALGWATVAEARRFEPGLR